MQYDRTKILDVQTPEVKAEFLSGVNKGAVRTDVAMQALALANAANGASPALFRTLTAPAAVPYFEMTLASVLAGGGRGGDTLVCDGVETDPATVVQLRKYPLGYLNVIEGDIVEQAAKAAYDVVFYDISLPGNRECIQRLASAAVATEPDKLRLVYATFYMQWRWVAIHARRDFGRGLLDPLLPHALQSALAVDIADRTGHPAFPIYSGVYRADPVLRIRPMKLVTVGVLCGKNAADHLGTIHERVADYNAPALYRVQASVALGMLEGYDRGYTPTDLAEIYSVNVSTAQAVLEANGRRVRRATASPRRDPRHHETVTKVLAERKNGPGPLVEVPRKEKTGIRLVKTTVG